MFREQAVAIALEKGAEICDLATVVGAGAAKIFTSP